VLSPAGSSGAHPRLAIAALPPNQGLATSEGLSAICDVWPPAKLSVGLPTAQPSLELIIRRLLRNAASVYQVRRHSSPCVRQASKRSSKEASIKRGLTKATSLAV